MLKNIIKKLMYNVSMLLLYLMSLLIFETILFIIFRITYNPEKEVFTSQADMFWVAYQVPIYAGMIFFIVFSIMAICIAFSKKVKKEYKYIMYFFPFLTFYFTLPVAVPACYIIEILNIPIGLMK